MTSVPLRGKCLSTDFRSKGYFPPVNVCKVANQSFYVLKTGCSLGK